MPDKKKRLVLLDIHAILHRAYHALPEFANAKGEPTGALYGLSAMLIRIIADLKPDYLVGAYDLPKPTYRHEAFKEYKAGRVKAEDDLISQIKKSRDIFKAFNIPVYEKEGFEADDIIGTIVEKMSADKNLEIIIASGDSDTLQLIKDPNIKVFTLKKGINDTVLYDEKAVKEKYGFGPELLPDYKGLRGDTSDNIPGIKGIGEKTATDILVNFGNLNEVYKKLSKDREAFLKAGIKERMIGLLEAGKEEAEFSKMLGTIRRDAPIEFSLSEKSWKDGLDFKRVEDLFSELDFRTLATRMKNTILGGNSIEKNAESEQEGKAEEIKANISEQEIEELCIAFWLLDSNKTNPTVEDIRAFTKTSDLKKSQEIIFGEIKKRGLTKVFEEIEKPLIPIAREMNIVGIKIDKSKLAEISVDLHERISALEKSIHDDAGEQEFNIASPKQLGEILFVKMGLAGKRQKKTASGTFSTAEAELEKIKDVHPVIAKVLEYRELTKLTSTYVDALPKLADEKGRIHGRFLQAGTTTGRMASQDPNLQNIPNKGEIGMGIRSCFIADKGKKFIVFDYSQIELRIAAFLSRDENLINIFKDGKDIHTSVASAVFNIAPEKVDKEMRRRAKVINFGIIYGMGINALRANLGTDREEAQKFYDEYFKKFDGLAKYLDKVKSETNRLGYTETFFGRRRYFEGIKSKIPYIKASAERMAINAPIQGTEADIVKLAMIKVDEYLASQKLKDKVKLLLQVHDELVYEIDNSLIEKIIPEIKKIMESVVGMEQTLGVPIIADASVGDSWGTLKKLKAES